MQNNTLDKITLYQGWIGAISAFWGLWGVISAILHLSWTLIGQKFVFQGAIDFLRSSRRIAPDVPGEDFWGGYRVARI